MAGYAESPVDNSVFVSKQKSGRMPCSCFFERRSSAKRARFVSQKGFIMRPAHQHVVFLLTVSVLAGCGTTSTSGPQWFRNPDRTSAGPSRDYDPQPDFNSRDTPVPPPPAPPAYGVSHTKIKSVGFLRRFGKRGSSGRGCGPVAGDSNCVDSSCREAPCVSGGCLGSETDDFVNCDAGACAESCGPRPKRRLFDCLRGGNHFRLFGRSVCGEDECCETVEDVCGDNVCGEKTECAPRCVPENDGCADWMNFGIENVEERAEVHQPSLAERLANPFFEDVDELDAAPEQEPEPAQSAVPAAPAPIPAPPQAILPSPFTGISASQPSKGYFPSESGEPRVIVEPPQWRGNAATQSAGIHHSVAGRNIVPGEPERPLHVPHQILIAPRQNLGN